MRNEKAADALNARYSVRKTLGDYPPWRGYSVTDSLSERDYLLFSVDAPDGVSLAMEDLRMRDHLFSRSEKLAQPVISLQQTNGTITFLLPHADIVPLASALPGMKPAEAARIARAIAAFILARLGEGLRFCNLTNDSFYVANGEPGLLPVAYLLPVDCLRRMVETGRDASDGAGPLLDDLRAAAPSSRASPPRSTGRPLPVSSFSPRGSNRSFPRRPGRKSAPRSTSSPPAPENASRRDGSSRPVFSQRLLRRRPFAR